MPSDSVEVNIWSTSAETRQFNIYINHILRVSDLSHYVSYVAKETDNDGVAIDDSRACHVIECESPRQANEIYAAVEYAFNQRAREPIKPMVIPEKAFGTLSGKNWDDTIPQGVEPSYYNTDPNKVPPESGLRRQPMPGQVTIFSLQRRI